jgi:hypothetical protein
VTRSVSPPGSGQDPARAALLALRNAISPAVVGQDAVVSGLVIALLCPWAPAFRELDSTAPPEPIAPRL